MYPGPKRIACRARRRVFLLALFARINFFTRSCPLLSGPQSLKKRKLCATRCATRLFSLGVPLENFWPNLLDLLSPGFLDRLCVVSHSAQEFLGELVLQHPSRDKFC